MATAVRISKRDGGQPLTKDGMGIVISIVSVTTSGVSALSEKR